MINPAVAELEQALRQLLLPASNRIFIGFSGGLDSTALLVLASRVSPLNKLVALHVNHNLQPQANDWETHCRQQAVALGVEFVSVNVVPTTASENDARDARYQAFESQLEDGDLLLLGHHLDDQAETVLMRLFRGSGVKGLAGMPHTRRLGRGRILRPLLSTSRSVLEALVVDAGLGWIEDPSNQNTAYLRNWIRQRLSPVLSERWPNWNARLGDTAHLLSDAAKLHRDLALIDAGGEFINPLPLKTELLPEPERLSNLLYYWLESNSVQLGSSAQLVDLVSTLVDGSQTGTWVFSGQTVHLYQACLWLEPGVIPEQLPRSINLEPGPINLSYGELELHQAEVGIAQGVKVELRARKPGDCVKLDVGHQSVKKFMNDKKIPPWLRDSWPLLVLEDEIISIVGVWVSSSAQQQGGLKVKWLR